MSGKFKVIRPFPVTDVSLVSSTVGAVDPLCTTESSTVSSSSVANPSVITVSAAHNIAVGDKFVVTIAGHTGSTPSINGEYLATSTGTATFTIPVNVTVGGTGGTAVTPCYKSGATYAVGTTIQVDSPTFAFTASGAVLTATAHGWANGTKLAVSTTGTLPTGLTAATVYYVVQAATNTLKLSLTQNGPPITTTGAGSGTHTATVSSHQLYESLVGGNVGNTPHKSPTQWLPLGATNRWKVFDQSVTSQTEQVTSVSYVLQAKGRVDSVALMNVSGAEVVLTARESGGGAIVYGPTTYSLLSSVPASSYWSWFFDPISRKADFVDIDFPPYNNLQVTITINDTGNTVKCGAVILGLSKTLGGTQYGASTGITDYSVKSQDDFGNYTVTERAFRKNGSFQIVVDRVASDGVQQLLEQYRATPVVYVGSTIYGATIIYGFYRDFTVNIAYPSHSICTIDVEGLT